MKSVYEELEMVVAYTFHHVLESTIELDVVSIVKKLGVVIT